MNHSRGTLKEFTVMNFASALLQTSLNGSDGAIERDKSNKNHKLNKRLDRRIKALREKTKEVLNEIGNNSSRDAATYTKKRLTKVTDTLQWLEKTEQNINLEILGIYILFVNFNPNERNNKKLDPAFKWFENSENYMDENAELIGSLLDGDTESDMFLLSYEIIERLKS